MDAAHHQVCPAPLIDDLDDLDYIERVKTQQKETDGLHRTDITFKTNMGEDVTVYTTRADTLFGTTYMVISPEHPTLKKWLPQIANRAEVGLSAQAARHPDFERGG